MKLQLGFSTGSLHKEFSTKEALSFLKGLKIKTVELGFVRMERFLNGWADNLTKEDLDGFDYVSLHSPVIGYGKNTETDFVFDKIRMINSLRKLDLVIFHPDTILDFSVFENLDFPVGFENMNNQKIHYKTPDEIVALLEENNYGLVLDVNHLYTNDKTMNLVNEFYEKVGGKIKEIHLSGCSRNHDPLFQTKQIQIIESIKDFNIPIINEATICSMDVKNEMDYMVKGINGILLRRK